jgi:hypothetical protein
VEEFLAYLRTLVARRRAAPGDPNADVLTRLIMGEADGERLTERELLHNCIFLLNAGHETTTNLIGNGLEALLRFPEERARLVADPGLIGTAVEEFLRFESSNQLGNRRAAADTEIGGVTVPAGTLITLCIGAANRDPGALPTGAAGRRPAAEPAPRLRRRRPHVRGDEPRPDGRAHRHRPLPRPLPRLPACVSPGARRAGAVPGLPVAPGAAGVMATRRGDA